MELGKVLFELVKNLVVLLSYFAYIFFFDVLTFFLGIGLADEEGDYFFLTLANVIAVILISVYIKLSMSFSRIISLLSLIILVCIESVIIYLAVAVYLETEYFVKSDGGDNFLASLNYQQFILVQAVKLIILLFGIFITLKNNRVENKITEVSDNQIVSES